MPINLPQQSMTFVAPALINGDIGEREVSLAAVAIG
jgi:hypothetical protein